MKLSLAAFAIFASSAAASESLLRSNKEFKRGLKKKGGKKKMKGKAATIPLIPGVAAGKITLAVDINYPPYAQLGPADEDFPVAGFGAEIANHLDEVCDVDIAVTQTTWANCWTNNAIGSGLARGEFHGCMTYTHAAGVRNRYLDFSAPILADNKAAGLIVKLTDGVPAIDGNSDLSGLKVLDVQGWAPTEDNLAIVSNGCTDAKFVDYEVVAPVSELANENDQALDALLKGQADALWIYADQAESYKCANAAADAPWDCTLWDGLGETFAYIQTGIFDWSRAGTTLSISKKGSGLADVLDPCIEAFLETESYYTICEKYGLTSDCFVNDFFPESAASVTPTYNLKTSELTSDCSSGYCKCPM